LTQPFVVPSPLQRVIGHHRLPHGRLKGTHLPSKWRMPCPLCTILSTIGALDDALARMFKTSSGATFTMLRQLAPVVAKDADTAPMKTRVAVTVLNMI